jgi:hypothetical protein
MMTNRITILLNYNIIITNTTIIVNQVYVCMYGSISIATIIISHRSSSAADRGSTDVPIRSNVSYIPAALSRSTSVRDSVQIEEQDEYSHLQY